MITIEPGIYRGYKGGLYFVQGIAWCREDPLNEKKVEVMYHPLYRVPNLDWRRGISPKKFLEHIDRPEHSYSGPRFVKILDWKLPNILPGCTRYIVSDCFWAITVYQVLLAGHQKEIFVEYGREENGKRESIPLTLTYSHPNIECVNQ